VTEMTRYDKTPVNLGKPNQGLGHALDRTEGGVYDRTIYVTEKGAKVSVGGREAEIKPRLVGAIKSDYDAAREELGLESLDDGIEAREISLKQLIKEIGEE
jgi:hypothetical protein